jgi:hypothetical protein
MVSFSPSSFPFELRKKKQVLVAIFSSRSEAKECRRRLEIGCVANSLASNKGRVVETVKGFAVYAW